MNLRYINILFKFERIDIPKPFS